MDTLSEIEKLIEARDQSEVRFGRRAKHIPILYGVSVVTFVGWIVAATLWYSSVEILKKDVQREFDRRYKIIQQMWEKVYGYPLP